tara:strand:+ start:403 stop:837 length:435 start_codon:yes stop_codon:yes gene_type:complete
MEILKLIEAKEKGKLIIESCNSLIQLDGATKYVEQFYKKFDDLVSYSELKIIINNKKKKLKEMDTLKNVMYAGLGLAKHTDDKLREQFDALVVKGKKVDEEGKNLVNNYFNLVEDLKKNTDEKFTESLNTNIDKVEEFLQKLKK